MEAQKGYYSLIQYCPDPSRLEVVNVGVLLFCPSLEFLGAKIARGNTKIRKAFGNQDWSLVNAQKHAIKERIEIARQQFQGLEDLQEYAARRANNIVISVPRPMKVFDAAEDLENLFERLVGERERHIGPRVTTRLKQIVFDSGVKDFLEESISVKVPTIEEELVVPYGYQNGCFNLIEPVRFEAADFNTTVSKACRHAVSGQYLSTLKDPQRGQFRLVVVGEFGQRSRADISTVRKILEDHSVWFHTFDDLGPLLEDIRASAAHSSQRR